jgi:hypothetical protein
MESPESVALLALRKVLQLAEGRVPANLKVEPAERVDLTTVYGLSEKEYREFAKYEKISKQIFSLR